MAVRLGDGVVSVSCEDPDTERAIRHRFAAHLDDAQIDRHALHVALDGAEGPGVRMVPHIRTGNRMLARHRDTSVVLDHLDRILGSMAAELADRPDMDRRWLALRVLVGRDDTRGLILAEDPPLLLGDHRLAAAGVRELVSWRVCLDGDHLDGDRLDVNHVTVPGSLTGTLAPQHLEVGAIAFLDSGAKPADSVAVLATRHASPVWFRTVHQQTESGLAGCGETSQLRSVIAGRLGSG